jgi:hypothetical protein
MRSYVALQISADERFTIEKTERSYARRLSCSSTCSTPTLKISRLLSWPRRTCSTRSRRRARRSARGANPRRGPGHQARRQVLTSGAADGARSHNLGGRSGGQSGVGSHDASGVGQHDGSHGESHVGSHGGSNVDSGDRSGAPGRTFHRCPVAADTFHDGPSAFSCVANTRRGISRRRKFFSRRSPDANGLFPAVRSPFLAWWIFPGARCAGRSARPRLPPADRRRWVVEFVAPVDMFAIVAILAARRHHPCAGQSAQLGACTRSGPSGVSGRVCWRTQASRPVWGFSDIFRGRPAACPKSPRFSPSLGARPSERPRPGFLSA